MGPKLQALAARGVRVAGSLKADLVQPVAETAVAALRQRCGLSSEHQVLLLASTSLMRSSLYANLEPAIAAISALAIGHCPASPERGTAIAKQAVSLGLAWKYGQLQ